MRLRAALIICGLLVAPSCQRTPATSADGGTDTSSDKGHGDALADLEADACVRSCGDRICGDDGCGGSCGACPDGTYCARGGGACSPCQAMESLCDGADEDCDGQLDDSCALIEGASYRVVLGETPSSGSGSHYAGVIRELFVRQGGEWVSAADPCNTGSCYGMSMIVPAIDMSHDTTTFRWSGAGDSIHRPYLVPFATHQTKWIYARQVSVDSTPAPGCFYHLRYVAEKICDAEGSEIYDGRLSLEYCFDLDGWTVHYGLQSRSDALVTTLIHQPLPVLRSAVANAWYADAKHKGSYPGAAYLTESGRQGIALFRAGAAMFTVAPVERHSLNPGFGIIQLIEKYSSASDVAAGVVAFFADDARYGSRDAYLAEGPSLGRWYTSSYRVEVTQAPATAPESLAEQALARLHARLSGTWLDAPYGLVPAAVFMHDANPFVQKSIAGTTEGEHQAQFADWQTLHKTYPRLRLEMYLLPRPNYTKCGPELQDYTFADPSLSCDPRDASCWVDQVAKAKLLQAEDEGWLVFSQHGDGHDGNSHCNCMPGSCPGRPNNRCCPAADWYLLSAAEAADLYNANAAVLNSFGSRTHAKRDIVPSQFLINTDGLRGLRSLGVLSHSGISAPQMIEPGLLEAKRVPNYRWHYLDAVDMAYLEQPFAITIATSAMPAAGTFLDPASVDHFINNAVPVFIYAHAFEFDPKPPIVPNTRGPAYGQAIARVEAQAAKTVWMLPAQIGQFVYGLARAKIAATTRTNDDVGFVVDNRVSQATAIEGLAFAVQGGPADYSIRSVTTVPQVTSCIQGARRFWVDVPAGARLQITAHLAAGPAVARGVLRARALRNAADVFDATVTVKKGDAVVHAGKPGDIHLEQGTYAVSIGGTTFPAVVVNGGRTELTAAVP